MTLTLGHFLALGAMLFTLSVVGIFLNRRNLIVLLMAIELMLLAVNMNFVAFSYYWGQMHGQIFVFFILTVAAAESAIGLELEGAVAGGGLEDVAAQIAQGLLAPAGLEPAALEPQQRRDGLQVVLHPVVDLTDGGVLRQQQPVQPA